MPGHLESLCRNINELMAMTCYDLAKHGIASVVLWSFKISFKFWVCFPARGLEQSTGSSGVKHQHCNCQKQVSSKACRSASSKLCLQIFEVKQFDYMRRTLGVTEDWHIQSWISSVSAILSLKLCFSWARISLPWKGRAKGQSLITSKKREPEIHGDTNTISPNIRHFCIKTPQ